VIKEVTIFKGEVTEVIKDVTIAIGDVNTVIKDVDIVKGDVNTVIKDVTHINYLETIKEIPMILSNTFEYQ
jgi:hypothetical protein